MKEELKGTRSLERIIYHTMVDGKGVLRRDYDILLNPYGARKRAPYPADQIGLLARVEKPFQATQIKLGKIGELLKRDVHSVRELDQSELYYWMRRAIARVGSESFNPEWRNRESQRQIHDKIEVSTAIPYLNNQILAEIAMNHVIQVFYDVLREKTHPKRRDMYRVADLGCGMDGTTICNHLQKLQELSERGLMPRKYNDYVEVLLVDVDPNATQGAANILSNPNRYKHLGYTFKPPRLIRRFNINFKELSNNAALQDYKGRVDTLISGAAPCHVPDKVEFFRAAYDLCSHRGAFFMWDWLAKTFVAQYLRIPVFAPGAFVFSLDFTGGRDSDFNMSELEKLSGVMGIRRDKGAVEVAFRDVDDIPDSIHEVLKGFRWSSKYELREDDVLPHLANMDAWLGYWGFKDPDNESRIDNIPISRFYKDNMFFRFIESKGGHSPIDDLVVNVLAYGKRNLKLYFVNRNRVSYNFIESYGREVWKSMGDAGFSAVDIGFDDAMKEARRDSESFDITFDKLSDTQKNMRHAIKFSVGVKDKDYFETVFPDKMLPLLGNGR